MPIHFKLVAPHRVSHYLEIEMTIDNVETDELALELPSWRPGRYELGNFARNIRKWQAFKENNELLVSRKVSKDSWRVATEGASTVIVRYDYYCAQADAGSCWVDDDQIYVNPIHCFLFIPDRFHEHCSVELVIPPNYRLACALNKSSENTFSAGDFHQLYDSPFICSSSLQVRSYSVADTEFFIYIHGNTKPDWIRILHDFTLFTAEQHKMMGSFPFSSFHFLIQALPYPFYHGVEHLCSTVLALGPGRKLMDEPLYDELTGVASHELFHTWNVKTIRPAEMTPYNYKNENYSRLGFVYEGVTTYYGDLFLARCGVYSIEKFFSEISARIQKHFDNPGRHNLAVADSSFDTWLDGYSPGIPGRKTSIYDEGCITALMTDLLIRKATQSSASLDDVMKTLYEDFGKRKIGYTEHDYISIVEFVARKPMADFFLDHVYGTEDNEALLTDLFSYAGCELVKRPSPEETENDYGFRTVIDNKATIVSAIAPNSPAFNEGLGRGDEIIAVNENKVEENIQEYFRLFSKERIVITVLTPMKVLKDITLAPGNEKYFPKYSIRKMKNPDRQRMDFFTSWLNQEFSDTLRVQNL